ncbi:MAG: transposase InsO family protein [Francisella sp.]|jgi:transposase InsO family protein
MTYDNGKEFSKHEDIEKETGMTVYFTRAYASWQRSANENTNGLYTIHLKNTIYKKIAFIAKLATMSACIYSYKKNRSKSCLTNIVQKKR